MIKKIAIGIVVIGILAAVFIALGGADLSAAVLEPTPEAADALPPVKAESLITADARVVPAQSADLSLPAGGIISELHVAEGEGV